MIEDTIEDTGMTRYDYAERVGRQSLQMLVIAARTRDRTMRDELHAFAERMADHAAWLCRRTDQSDARIAVDTRVDALQGSL